jgi:hypothetical protein
MDVTMGHVEIIAATRRAAVKSLCQVLTAGLEANLSEQEIRDRWHAGLQANPKLLSEGWYAPPPHGIIVVIGSPEDGFSRNGTPSFRGQQAWPSAERWLKQESLLTVYASPIDRDTGLIGDIMATIYWGQDAALQQHIRNARQITEAIVEKAEAGMSFKDLYQIATGIIEQQGMSNAIVGVNDPTGTNIGHTIPWSTEPPSAAEQEILNSGDSKAIAALISGKRIFINSAESYEIPETGAFSVEPRLSTDGQPAIGYHIVVAFDQGRKHVINELEPLLRLSR